MTFGEGDTGAGAEETTTAGAGAEGAPQGGAVAEGGAAAATQEDPIGRLVASMETFQQGVTERLGGFEQRLPALPAAEAEESDDGFDLAAMLEELPDEAFDQGGEITPEGQMELMRQVARAEADAVRSEQAQRAVEAEHDAYANQLEEKYTDLQNPENQTKVLAEAERLAKQMGQPGLAGNPYFFEQTYLSMAARARAEAETPAQRADRGAQLEQPGGGGGPVSDQGGPSVQQRIVGAATGSKFRLGT